MEGKDLKSADERAVVEQEINELTSDIKNDAIARQYRTALMENLWNYGRGIDKNQQIARKNKSILGTKTAKFKAQEKNNHEETLLLALTLQTPSAYPYVLRSNLLKLFFLIANIRYYKKQSWTF